MTEKEKFDATMKKVLSVSKQELQRRLEEEKKTKVLRSGTGLPQP
jgi:hypothetical protein